MPKVILFRLEHTRRTLVEKVDFISAPGTSADNVYRPGGPVALITNRCLFAFDRERRRFRLASVHPGHTLAEVEEHTAFDVRPPGRRCRTTPAPSPETLRLLRTVVAPQLVEVYPKFAADVFGIAQPANRPRSSPRRCHHREAVIQITATHGELRTMPLRSQCVFMRPLSQA